MGAKELVLGTFQWLVLVILLLVPLGFCLLWKICVILIAKCLRRDLILPRALDSINAPGPGDIRSVINFGVVVRMEGTVSADELRNLFTNCFLTKENYYKRFSYSLVNFGGFAFFKKLEQFDINQLIYVKDLAEGHSLEELLETWILAKYRENLPIWELIIVPLKETNETAVAFKVHHSLADGYSLLHILDKLCSASSPYLVKDDDNDSLGQKVSQMLQLPCYLGKLKGDVETNPFVIEKESPYLRKWTFTFTRLPLESLKRIRRKHNVHFSSIILSILGGALRRYLLETKDLMKGGGLPSYLNMGTTLPWKKHPSKDPNVPENLRVCNHWVTAVVQVPIGGENALERLLLTEKSLEEFKGMGIPRFLKWILIPLMWTFPVTLLRALFQKDAGFSGGYSTILGGEGYNLCGNRISTINSMIALHDCNPFIPISVFSFTHSNVYELTLSVNPQHFPNRASLVKVADEYLSQELVELERLSFVNGHTNF